MRSTRHVMRSIAMLAALALVASALKARAAEVTKEEVEVLKKQQAELLDVVKSQQKRIEELEQARTRAVMAQKMGGTPIEKASAVTEGKVDPMKEPVRWNEIVAGNSKIKFYGFLRLDMTYHTSPPDNTQVIAFARSGDPRAPVNIGAIEDNQMLSIYPRLTRFGFDLKGPQIDMLGNPDLTGKFEIDFYNSGLLGQSESRAALRMRHAWLKLKWNDLFVLAGQTSDLIAPLWPIVNPNLVMWGAGNLGDRRPQFRADWSPKLGPGNVILQGMIGLTGADDNQNIDPATSTGSNFRDGEASGLPTLQARAGYTMKLWEKEKFEFALWGHRAWEKTDARFARKNDWDSYALGFDLTVPIYKDMFWVQSEGWFGKNVDDVRGGIFQGINTTRGVEIGSRGGFVELGFRPPMAKWYSLHLGYAADDPHDRDLSAGARSENKILYVGNRFNFNPVEIGVDYLHWETDFLGFNKGKLGRFQFYIQYKF